GSNRLVSIDECDHTYAFDSFSVKALDHPLSVPLFLYVNPGQGNGERDSFVDFVMSTEAGQGIVGKHFANLEVLIADEQASRERIDIISRREPELRNSQALFRALIGNARRISTTFRFRYDNSTLELDSYGERALERLVSKVRDENISPEMIMLFGFADSLGEASYNLELASRRADSVASGLAERGLTISKGNVFAIGEDAPVGCNLNGDGEIDERGTARNRRVEVWVRTES
ncbi:MAG: phosphate ABC transporter substrate-binding/OmpA family protein, partial [Geminicoccaceae bacterium]